MHICIDCIDWLVAYAADGQNFQGISRTNEDSAVGSAVADYLREWDFNAKVWECQSMAGAHTGQEASQEPKVLSRDDWEKLDALALVDSCFSKATCSE